MQNSKRIWAVGIALIIFAIILLALAQGQNGIGAPDSASTTAETSAATSTQTHDGVRGSGNFTVSSEDTIDIKLPDFRAPIQFSPTIQADVKSALQAAANTLAGRLAVDSLDLKSWIDLGTVRKMAGDYKGAEIAWLFVAKYAPTNPMAFANLGDLYATYLKNYPKAEQNYFTDLKLSPDDESAYINLSTMYKHSYQTNTSAAEDILKKGIATLPNSIPLHMELARFYKEKGEMAKAKAQYEAAIAAAKANGQSTLVEQIQVEENQ